MLLKENVEDIYDSYDGRRTMYKMRFTALES